ncbi:MAG TPA: metal-dependent hydrolase [Methanosarcinales archaeon]|nr:metal-dependent hydrolase [Methanosarcinales archaeon]
MLGKDHIILSLFTVSAIFMPFLLDRTNTGLFVLAMIGVGIGSLAPDADSQDAAIFHTKVKGLKGGTRKLIDTCIGPFLPIFGFIQKFLIYLPAVKIIQFLVKENKISLQYRVTETHRGILHSVLGLLISFAALLIYSSILMILFPELLSIKTLLVFNVAFSIGFFLHLLEDSCTVSGVNFTFPMNKKLLFKGEVRTGKIDYSTGAFESWLGALNVGHFLASALSKENASINSIQIELIVILIIIISWLIFIRLSGVKRY